MINLKLSINKQDVSDYIPYPFREIKALDESLDGVNFQLVNTAEKEPFKPFSNIVGEISDGTTTNEILMFVSNDKNKEILCSNEFTHDITGIESTKLLERRLIGGKTFTNPSTKVWEFVPVIYKSPIIARKTIVNGLDVIQKGQEIPSKYAEWNSDYYPYIAENTFLTFNYSIIPNANGSSFYAFPANDFIDFPLSAGIFAYYSIEVYFNNEIISSSDIVSLDQLILNGLDFKDTGNYVFKYILYDTNKNDLAECDINLLSTDKILKFTLLPNNDITTINTDALNQIENYYLINSSILGQDLLNVNINATSAEVVDPDGFRSEIVGTDNVQLSKLGIYYVFLKNSSGNAVMIIRINVKETDILLVRSITDVINSVLATQKSLSYSEDVIDNAEIRLLTPIAEELSQIEAPEFCFTNQQSLWEVLSIIGGYIHAIPRLIRGYTNQDPNSNTTFTYLTFDKLGSGETANFNFDNYVINESNYSIEQYCSEIVSTVENMVNYERDGAITDPGLNYRSLRTESGIAYMTEEGLIIRTAQPIEKLVSLTCSPLSDGTVVGDLTSYCYENSQYQCLSSYDGSFPNSKAYGIYWTQGEKDIKGLTFKNPDVISPVFQLYAIQNIICNKTGKSNDWFNNLFLQNSLYLQNLMFTVSYIPRVTLRASQNKSCFTEGEQSQIAYNQSSTLIDSKHFGEAQKGVVDRLGNIDIVRSYVFYELSEIPKIGEVVINEQGEEYYISSMIIDYYKDFIQAQIAFSKDFNRLNAYVGIENRLRFYEVDINQVIDRFFNIDEYCIISYEDESYNYGMVQDNVIKYFAYPFIQDTDLNLKITYAISGTSNDNENFTSVLLPVISYGIGNTMIFQYSYEDNFSAGDQVVLNGSTRVQQQVQYGNENGEAKQIQIDLYAGETPTNTWSDSLKDYADLLPEILTFDKSTYFSSSFQGGNRYSYYLDKDNRERINVVYQMHFVAKSNKIIVGSGLASKNPFTSNETLRYKLYVCKKRLNKLSKNLILDSNFVEQDYNGAYWDTLFSAPKVYFNNFTPNTDGVAWAFINTSANGESELIYGSNINITQGQEVELPTLTFRTNL